MNGSRQRDRRRRGARALALLGGVLVLVLFGGVGGASAHAALTSTDPQDGSVLKSAPRQVTLTFSESIGLLDDSFRVLTPENRRVHTGEPSHADGRSDTARVTLPRGLGTGTFTVAWRVVSADSHPVSGAFTFSIGKPSATAAPLPPTGGDPASAALYDIARYAAYGGLALLIGATTFFLACGFPGSVRRLLVTGWWILLGSTLALLLLRGPYERGTGPGEVFDPAILRDTLTSRPGIVLVARLALLAAAAFLPLRAPAGDREAGRGVLVLGGLFSLGLAVTWAASEHASAGIQVPVAMVSSVLHLLAMAVWLGGLTALLTALYRPAELIPPAVVTRFSRLALTSVAVLAATGVYQSWRGLGSWDALTATSYGRLLVVKLGAVALLLVGAAYSRRWTARLAVTAASENSEASESSEASETSVAVPAERVAVAVTAGATADKDTGAASTAAGDTDTGTDTDTDTAIGSGGGQKDAAERASEDGRADGRQDAGGDGPAGAAYHRGLRRSVLAEVTVGILVLVITTMLTGTQPGRAATETAAAVAAADRPTSSTTVVPFDVGTPGGHGKVQVELSPGRVGENSVQAVIIGPDGGLATVPELRLTFTLESQKVGPIDAEVTDKGGYWTSDGLTLPLPGTWTMKVTVRTTDIDQITVSKHVKID
ncbi:copper resistance protein CopC [Streptomyces sp. NBC_00568]|uniref:copper resistance protein CopC n=1 Tax=Streptomyces sp. NBC_00568 TaxID=2975779 RepID=UPI0022557945|nr:copper resistance protein CopC [Streptomyces sp. NBC_00568]MCX4989925.1 copper resistance protein CopC [Streptomyces sp. NBC_00568]